MFTIKRKINFYDCDPAGILFYARVFELCHSAYEAMIESFKLNFDYWMNDNYAVPIIKSSAEYLIPFKPGDEAVIKVSVSVLKDSSFELSYECSNGSNQVCMKVKTVHVWINKKSWEKTEIPSELSAALKRYQS